MIIIIDQPVMIFYSDILVMYSMMIWYSMTHYSIWYDDMLLLKWSLMIIGIITDSK